MNSEQYFKICSIQYTLNVRFISIKLRIVSQYAAMYHTCNMSV